MLRLGVLAIVAAILTAQAPIPSVSQPPPNSVRAEAPAKAGENKPAQNERGTEKSPLIVKVVAPPNDERKAAEEAQERSQQAVMERNLADYTWYLVLATCALAAIALVQAILFMWQLLYMKAGLAESAAATKAATKASAAAIAIELPVIRPTGPDSLLYVETLPAPNAPYGGGVYNGEIPPKRFVLSDVGFRNVGRSHALLHETLIGWCVASTLPNEPQYTETFVSKPGDIVKPDGEKMLSIDLGIELSAEQRVQLEAKVAFFWLYGALRYFDFMGEPHEIGFCWKWGREVEAGLYYFFSASDVPKAYLRRI